MMKAFVRMCRKVLIFLLVGMANILDVSVIGNGSVLRTGRRDCRLRDMIMGQCREK